MTEDDDGIGGHIAEFILALLFAAIISLAGFFYVITHDTDKAPPVTTTTQVLQQH